MTELSEASQLRTRVHDLRVHIENIAADSYALATGTERKQERIAARLLSLLVVEVDDQWRDSYRLIKLARHCYKHSCDLLHGRSSMLAVSPSVVAEWEDIVSRIQDLHDRQTAAREQQRAVSPGSLDSADVRPPTLG